MTKDNKENSLQKRFSSDKKDTSENNFSSERKRRPQPKRNDNILSSDDYSISETGIEYNPKKRREFNNNRKDDRRNDRDSSIKRNNSEKPYSNNRRNNSEKPYSNRKNNSSSDNKDYNDSRKDDRRNDRDFSTKRNNSEKPYSNNRRNNSEKPYSNRKSNSSSDNKDYNDSRKDDRRNDRDFSTKRNNSEKPYSNNRRNNSEKPYSNRKSNSSSDNKDYNDSNKPFNRNKKDYDKKDNNDRRNNYDRNDDKYRQDRGNGKYGHSGKGKRSSSSNQDDTFIRLNKYIADSGLCSRRQADVLIESGSVKVNDIIVDKVGTKIKKTDKVQVGGETLRHEKLKYLLLNKPKGYVTTMSDPEKRNTVLQLVHSACKERIYPVGRLDRNTTGLLLFTNDGDLANKLMHPRSNVEKIYHVELDKPLTKNDMLTIADGIELEDGFIAVDSIAYSNSDNKKEIGVQIHSGKNRVIRRIFEKLGYEVLKLDRTLYAGLTKKDLPRGKWRFLTDKEISFLKMI